MAEDDKKIDIDMDDLSDEDFLKLDEPPAVVEETQTGEETPDEGTATGAAAGDNSDAEGEGTPPGDAEPGAGAGDEQGEGEGGEAGEEAALTDEEKAAAAEKVAADEAAAAAETKGANADKETLTIKKGEGEAEPTDEEKAAAKEAEEAKEAEAAVAAQATSDDFFKKVSAPFRADGKDVQVRTPEEAVRLMQMGVNYSRRMKEMKPLREMDAMLTAHGLNDPNKLNELIDLSKGSKEAIQKYLKQHNIDPLDLDPSKGDDHATPNYRSDPKDVAFQDAIDNTLLATGGKDLLGDVNRDWDNESKEALRENPSIFNKLLEQKDSGVYDQIQKELLHQRTLGYLADVPFLQAYEDVGNAMQKAGVFDKKKVPQKKTGLAPLGSGSRKAAPKPKTEPPNPNLSSASKSRNFASNDADTQEPDYLSMSDEDFLKLGQPA